MTHFCTKLLRPTLASGILSLLALTAAPAANAHITLETQEAAVGGYYKAVLRVPHGCDGSDTIGLRVKIPDGVLEVKPMPKPGWALAIKQGKYDHPQTLHGAQVDQGVQEISWSGGDLPDAYYDEFTFRVYLTKSLKPDTTLYFPTIQECKKGETRWIDTSGKDDETSDPAPHVRLTDPATPPSGHHGK